MAILFKPRDYSAQGSTAIINEVDEMGAFPRAPRDIINDIENDKDIPLSRNDALNLLEDGKLMLPDINVIFDANSDAPLGLLIETNEETLALVSSPELLSHAKTYFDGVIQRKLEDIGLKQKPASNALHKVQESAMPIDPDLFFEIVMAPRNKGYREIDTNKYQDTFTDKEGLFPRTAAEIYAELKTHGFSQEQFDNLMGNCLESLEETLLPDNHLIYDPSRDVPLGIVEAGGLPLVKEGRLTGIKDAYHDWLMNYFQDNPEAFIPVNLPLRQAEYKTYLSVIKACFTRAAEPDKKWDNTEALTFMVGTPPKGHVLYPKEYFTVQGYTSPQEAIRRNNIVLSDNDVRNLQGIMAKGFSETIIYQNGIHGTPVRENYRYLFPSNAPLGFIITGKNIREQFSHFLQNSQFINDKESHRQAIQASDAFREEFMRCAYIAATRHCARHFNMDIYKAPYLQTDGYFFGRTKIDPNDKLKQSLPFTVPEGFEFPSQN